MDCSEVKQKIDPYIDRQMSQEQRSAIENHLNRCRDCKALVNKRVQLKQLLEIIKEPRMPQAVIEKTISSVQKINMNFWKIFKRAAAAVIILGFVTGIAGNLLLSEEEAGPLSSELYFETISSTFSSGPTVLEIESQWPANGELAVESQTVDESVKPEENHQRSNKP